MKKLLVLCLLIKGFMLTSCNSKQQEKQKTQAINFQAISEAKVHKGIDSILTHPSSIDLVREFQIYNYQPIHTHLDSSITCLLEAERSYNEINQYIQKIRSPEPMEDKNPEVIRRLYQSITDSVLSNKKWLIKYNKIDSICTKYFSHQCRINNRDCTLVITTTVNDSILSFDAPKKQK
ncbi:hypothetical protein [Xanthocytophaga agilis]|uniref:Uncharacterized protein n=1 Tax=Xanthocytophaga agilis TaxID=3048010 RepID=A0AAE3R4K3_9BACT|nr:hypothetical protein [Xanthocytophaga agilis]MDJ1503639.1 hypothetical protein [Xanthocytophaga agilis]